MARAEGMHGGEKAPSSAVDLGAPGAPRCMNAFLSRRGHRDRRPSLSPVLVGIKMNNETILESMNVDDGSGDGEISNVSNLDYEDISVGERFAINFPVESDDETGGNSLYDDLTISLLEEHKHFQADPDEGSENDERRAIFEENAAEGFECNADSSGDDVVFVSSSENFAQGKTGPIAVKSELREATLCNGGATIVPKPASLVPVLSKTQRKKERKRQKFASNLTWTRPGYEFGLSRKKLPKTTDEHLSLPIPYSNKKPTSVTLPLKTFKMAVIQQGFANMFLTQQQADIVQEKLMSAIDQIPPNQTPPQFTRCRYVSGCVWIDCANFDTKSWLLQTVQDPVGLWEGAALTAVSASQVFPKKFKVLLRVTDTRDEKLVKRLLDGQNPDMKVAEWSLHNKKVKDNEQILVYSMNNESLNILHRNHFKVYFGLGMLRCKQVR